MPSALEDKDAIREVLAEYCFALDGDRASVRSNWTTVQNDSGGPKIGSGGAYADDMVRTADGWRFKLRKIDRFIKPDA